jgi:hypothetical protein
MKRKDKQGGDMTSSHKLPVKEVIKIMRIKPTSAYEDMRIYYTVDVIRLIHVSVTYCGHLQGGAFGRIG